MSSLFAEIFALLKTPGFTQFVQQFGYVGILIWFITVDQLTPFPEEISLLIVGYLSAHHVFNPIIAGLFCLAGFLAVDTGYFFLSKKGSSLIKKITKGSSSVMESYKKKLQDNMPKAVIFLSFIPRMRMFAPILAGSLKVPFKKFLFYDTLALIAFTCGYVSLGIVFHKTLSSVIHKTKGLQNVVFFGASIILAGIIIFFVTRGRKEHGKGN